jgi:hypothetical protein
MNRNGSCLMVAFWWISTRSNCLKYDNGTLSAPQEAEVCRAMQLCSPKAAKQRHRNEDSQDLDFGQSG